jgi:hypothetical protein
MPALYGRYRTEPCTGCTGQGPVSAVQDSALYRPYRTEPCTGRTGQSPVPAVQDSAPSRSVTGGWVRDPPGAG